MKKIISVLLCICLIAVFPLANVNAKANISKPTITVTTGVNSAKITIKKVSGAKKYRIYMRHKCKSCGGAWVRIKTTKALEFTKKSLNSGEIYQFKVKAFGKNGAKSSFSKVKSVTVKSNSYKQTTATTTTSTSYNYSNVVYITDTGTKYHKYGCSSLSRSCHEISLSNATAQGYTPCARCH